MTNNATRPSEVVVMTHGGDGGGGGHEGDGRTRWTGYPTSITTGEKPTEV